MALGQLQRAAFPVHFHQVLGIFVAEDFTSAGVQITADVWNNRSWDRLKFLAPAICVTLRQSMMSWHKHRQNKLSDPVSRNRSWYIIKWPCRTILKRLLYCFRSKALGTRVSLTVVSAWFHPSCRLHLLLVPSPDGVKLFGHPQNRCTGIGDAFGFTLAFNVVTTRLWARPQEVWQIWIRICPKWVFLHLLLHVINCSSVAIRSQKNTS